MHGEVDEAPIAVAESFENHVGRGAVQRRGGRYDDDGKSDEPEGVGKPAFCPIGEAQRNAGEAAFAGRPGVPVTTYSIIPPWPPEFRDSRY